MKNLKTISKYSICFLLLISFNINFNQQKISKYNKNETTIYGIVTSCEKKDNKVILIIKGKEKLLINYYNPYKCKLGEKIKAKGKLIKPEKNRVFLLFNYQKYLLSKKIHYTFTAKTIEKTKNKVNIKYKIKNKIINHINKYRSKAYLKTFILGNNNEINKNIKKSYKNNGISHLLALSGMHVMIITHVLIVTLNKIIQNKIISKIIIIYILVFNLFITNYPASLIRAVLSYIVINKELKARKEFIYLLIILLLLNINPYYIYDLGFLLSFTITIYLSIFKKLLNSKNYFIKLFETSLIAFLSSIPYIINNFFELNFLSIILNLLFVPMVSFLIYPLSLLTFFIKPLDNIFYYLIKIMETLFLKIEKINYLTFTFAHMSLPFLMFYFGIITVLLIIWKQKEKNYLWILILILIIHNNINSFNTKNSVTAIDVGQGDSILIKTKKNKGNILIDTGGDINSAAHNIAQNRIVPYLKAEGIKKLNYLILTHGDFDHMGEAINLVNNFKVEKVIFNCGEFNNLEKELIKVLDKKEIKYYSCIKKLNIDKNKLYFLQTKEYDNENDNSNVIITELDGYKFMFMGDASSTTEKEILDKYNLPYIDVLKVGHHGSKTSSSKDFINKINPMYSVISVGKNNRYGHPNKEVIDNLENSKIYRTDQDGSIMFKIKNDKLKIKTCAP